MALVEDDHMVEQLAPDSSDEAHGDTVLPRATEGGPDRLNAHGPGYLPAPVADAEEDVQDAEGRGGDGEEVHGGEAVTMVLQERRPVWVGLGRCGRERR